MFYYSIGGASRKLGTSMDNVRKLIVDGVLEHAQFGANNRLLIPAKSVHAYMQRKLDGE